LGEQVLGFWRGWFETAAAGNSLNDISFPMFDGTLGDLDVVDSALTTRINTASGTVDMPDIRKLDFLRRRIIVSRKRTKNLFDLTSLWKKTVLRSFEEEVL
ncbi:hypothetical protein GALMADRAFT_20561, partial [Galerina marginata CBS 339.88]